MDWTSKWNKSKFTETKPFRNVIAIISFTVEEHFGIESPTTKSEYGKFLGIPGQGKLLNYDACIMETLILFYFVTHIS